MSGRPRSEHASEEASAMPQESVRQIQLKESLRLCVSAIKKEAGKHQLRCGSL